MVEVVKQGMGTYVLTTVDDRVAHQVLQEPVVRLELHCVVNEKQEETITPPQR